MQFKYEYVTLQSPTDADLNEYGEKGYRIVAVSTTPHDFSSTRYVYMERVIIPEPDEQSTVDGNKETE